jgi:TatD DNase family protein
MRLFDTHVHLNQIDDIQGALERARGNQVDKILVAGLDLDSNKALIDLYASIKNYTLYLALGIHPYLPQRETCQEVYSLIRQYRENIVAVGEIGLDYWYKEAREAGGGRNLQKEIFKEQLALAKEIDKPVIVHSRAAWNDCLKLVKEFELSKVLFHWYTGPLDILGDISKSGYYVSLSPSLEYSKEAQEVALSAPIDRILLETDSPVQYRPQSGNYISEPKDVKRVLIKLCQLKKISDEAAAKIIYKSSCDFFNITD